MHPVTIVEVIIATGILITFLIGAMLWKRRRKLFLLITGLVLLAEITFFIVRPYWIDYQIAERKIELEKYLETTYPSEHWEIFISDYKEYPSENPYYLQVTFETEPFVTYSYYVDGKGNIQQKSIYTINSIPLEHLKHLEQQ